MVRNTVLISNNGIYQITGTIINFKGCTGQKSSSREAH